MSTLLDTINISPPPSFATTAPKMTLLRFGQLENSITNWVLTYFKDMPSGRGLLQELATLVPTYEALLKQRRTQFLVIRAVVAHVLTEGFGTAGFLGESYRRLGEVLEEKDRIAGLLSPSTTPEPDPERLTLLRQLVTAASQLAVDLAKQHARYEVSDNFESREMSAILFDPSFMEDVLQESKTEVSPKGALINRLSGKEVRVIVFPLVVRWVEGKSTVISKAKVLA
ncbi:hypothetical protein GP486_004966 [Trichoglossum hirsutum]|uniref:Uncharacterized protein n=1 Tax=Trichoglossum hirsutum TaxID=265104 RepID=A0A9P8RN46_9PEZI|nr:hypothetical protein GP486_004966 [Trichoglossum hirsutum]